MGLGAHDDGHSGFAVRVHAQKRPGPSLDGSHRDPAAPRPAPGLVSFLVWSEKIRSRPDVLAASFAAVEVVRVLARGQCPPDTASACPFWHGTGTARRVSHANCAIGPGSLPGQALVTRCMLRPSYRFAVLPRAQGRRGEMGAEIRPGPIPEASEHATCLLSAGSCGRPGRLSFLAGERCTSTSDNGSSFSA